MTDPQTLSTIYKVRAEHYGNKMRRALLQLPTFVLIWFLISVVSDFLFPSFRSSYPVWSNGWFRRTLVIAAIWSVFMTLFESFRGRPEYELEIRSDRIVKYSKGTSDTIFSHGALVTNELRTFGKLRGLTVRSKDPGRITPSAHLFIPAGHPQYADIKQELELWHS